MTSEQKKEIIRLRSQDVGYTTIANLLGISKDTVKTFCKRNDIGGVRAEIKNTAEGCPHCGKPVPQIPGRKPRRFCSDECRKKWWNSHPEKVGQKAVYEFTCPSCGEHFTAYGNNHRKYCSHACYISARYKGGAAV